MINGVKMKNLILALTFILSSSAVAQNETVEAPAANRAPASTKTPAPAAKATTERKVAGKPAPPADPCKVRVEAAIRRTMALIYKNQFAFELYDGEEVPGKDSKDRALTEFNTSIFHINEGTMSHSGATAIVANAKAECVIVKLSVNAGVPNEN